MHLITQVYILTKYLNQNKMGHSIINDVLRKCFNIYRFCLKKYTKNVGKFLPFDCRIWSRRDTFCWCYLVLELRTQQLGLQCKNLRKTEIFLVSFSSVLRSIRGRKERLVASRGRSLYELHQSLFSHFFRRWLRRLNSCAAFLSACKWQQSCQRHYGQATP